MQRGNSVNSRERTWGECLAEISLHPSKSFTVMYMRIRKTLLAAFALSLGPLGVQAQKLNLIPYPREVRPGPSLSILEGVRVVCTACSPEDQFAADDLAQDLQARGIRTVTTGGFALELTRLGNAPLPAGLTFDEPMRAEGYVISASATTLTVTAATAEGVFYGAQTVKQMVEINRHLQGSAVTILHAATIRDWPAMKYRGLDDDLSRGPVTTLDFQKKLIRTLAAYKVNLYSPYFESAMAYASNPLAAQPNGSMSAADARALVAYARPFHVMVVPEQEAFGHLHHLLTWEQYQPLAETPHGEVLAPGQPGSIELIRQWFTELAALYPAPFLHIGADETVDLGVGQTKPDVDARGLGPVYLDFLEKIVTALAPLHRKLLFWGDIAMDSPDLVKSMPASFKQSTIAIAWTYNPDPRGFDRYLLPFTRAGFETWVAPGVNNWSRVYPNNNLALVNIQQFVRDGQRLGSTGALNTVWNDDGEGLINSDWYGILFGAAAAWQHGESSIPQFQSSYAQVFHGDTTGALNEAQTEMMAAHSLLRDRAKTGDGSDGLFWMDPWSKDGLAYADKIRPYTHELRLHAERALTLIAQARSASPAPPPSFTVAANGAAPYNPANAYPSDPTTLRETDAIDALELGARRMDLIGMKFQLAEEMAAAYARAYAMQTSTDRKQRLLVSAELSHINGVSGRIRDLRDTYSLLRDLYEQAWLRSNRPYALRPVLEHYDYTVQTWIGRSDKVRVAQRQWEATHTLPLASDVGIPAPPPGAK